MKQFAVPAPVVAAVLLLAAACGGGDEEPRPVVTQPVVTATAVRATPAATATEPATATGTAVPATTQAATAAPTTTPTATPTAAPAATGEPEPVASTAAIPVEQLGVVEFTRRSDGVAVALAVEAPPRSEYSIGLSGRYELGERGMLFQYASDTRGPFWMRNTHIDLSIAFVDGEGRVVEIREMTAESLDFVRPDSDYRFAVEAPAGWYARNGIEPGDVMLANFEFTPGE